MLHLSEEDFQKVRTSRKKKATVETNVIDENLIASETILRQYDESNSDVHENENYNHQLTASDEGTVWMEESKQEKYENFTITGEIEDIENNDDEESRVCKTDFLETEDTENEQFNSTHHHHHHQLLDRISQPISEENSIVLDETVETDLEFMKSNTQILYENNANQEIYNVDEYEDENIAEEILGYEEQVLQDIDVIHEVQVK